MRDANRRHGRRRRDNASPRRLGAVALTRGALMPVLIARENVSGAGETLPMDGAKPRARIRPWQTARGDVPLNVALVASWAYEAAADLAQLHLVEVAHAHDAVAQGRTSILSKGVTPSVKERVRDAVSAVVPTADPLMAVAPAPVVRTGARHTPPTTGHNSGASDTKRAREIGALAVADGATTSKIMNISSPTRPHAQA